MRADGPVRAADWSRIDLAAPSSVESLAAELDASPLAAQLTLNHEPRWLATLVDQPEKRLCAYVCRDHGALVGYVTFFLRPDRIKATVGPVTTIARSVRMYEAFAAPLTTGRVAGATDQELLRSMLARLRADLQPDDVLLFSAVAEGSVVHEVLSPGVAKADGFESVQHGPFYPHRTARVTDEYEDYLNSLGSRTRADLRTTRKKFVAQAPAGVRTRRFTTLAEVDEFVRDAMAVSRTTWQFQNLQAGLRDADALAQQFRTTAELGWFRSYVVYVGEQPVAFQVGHVHRDVYHAQDTGYDPQWARLSAGIYQHTEIMMDLARDGAIRVLDFDRGDFSHKQRLATDATPLGYFHLIPSTPRGRLLAASLRMTHATSRLLGTLLERLGLRDRSRQLSRSGLARRQ